MALATWTKAGRTTWRSSERGGTAMHVARSCRSRAEGIQVGELIEDRSHDRPTEGTVHKGRERRSHERKPRWPWGEKTPRSAEPRAEEGLQNIDCPAYHWYASGMDNLLDCEHRLVSQLEALGEECAHYIGRLGGWELRLHHMEFYVSELITD